MVEIGSMAVYALSMLKRIGRYEGNGRLDPDSGGAAVSYALDEYQDIQSSRTLSGLTQTMAGMKQIRGSIRAVTGALPSIGDAYILHLQDGRKIKLLSESTDGSSAQVRGTGGFF